MGYLVYTIYWTPPHFLTLYTHSSIRFGETRSKRSSFFFILAREAPEERLVPIPYVQILKLFKDIQVVGDDPQRSFTGHSPKRGALQHLLLLGVNPKSLYTVTKHKSPEAPPEVTIRYLRELLPLVGLANGSILLTNRL